MPDDAVELLELEAAADVVCEAAPELVALLQGLVLFVEHPVSGHVPDEVQGRVAAAFVLQRGHVEKEEGVDLVAGGEVALEQLLEVRQIILGEALSIRSESIR